MAVTILEALENANYNLDNLRSIGIGILPLIQGQLGNAIVLLDKGYGIDDEIEPLLEKYGDVDAVPYKITK